ncbi:hypothetical protein [Pseudoalteromonas sp. T1lg22]|uniref:hypothetical protein n=1 Tax=Pseudoalteromonas sp. T1lg22 TaxID=2077096 RepID=UPI000CF68020|nr:hypothetical protein [Pseudoalteromonas sp. T1lg22]
MTIQSLFFARHHGAENAQTNTFVSANEQIIDLGGSEVLLLLQSLKTSTLNWANKTGMAVRYELAEQAHSFDVFFLSDTALRIVTNDAEPLLAVLDTASESFDVDILPRPELNCLHFSGPDAGEFLSQQFSLYMGMALGDNSQHYGVQCDDCFVIASAKDAQQYYRVFALSSTLTDLTHSLTSARFNPQAQAA